MVHARDGTRSHATDTVASRGDGSPPLPVRAARSPRTPRSPRTSTTRNGVPRTQDGNAFRTLQSPAFSATSAVSVPSTMLSDVPSPNQSVVAPDSSRVAGTSTSKLDILMSGLQEFDSGSTSPSPPPIDDRVLPPSVGTGVSYPTLGFGATSQFHTAPPTDRLPSATISNLSRGSFDLDAVQRELSTIANPVQEDASTPAQDSPMHQPIIQSNGHVGLFRDNVDDSSPTSQSSGPLSGEGIFRKVSKHVGVADGVDSFQDQVDFSMSSSNFIARNRVNEGSTSHVTVNNAFDNSDTSITFVNNITNGSNVFSNGITGAGSRSDLVVADNSSAYHFDHSMPLSPSKIYEEQDVHHSSNGTGMNGVYNSRSGVGNDNDDDFEEEKQLSEAYLFDVSVPHVSQMSDILSTSVTAKNMTSNSPLRAETTNRTNDYGNAGSDVISPDSVSSAISSDISAPGTALRALATPATAAMVGQYATVSSPKTPVLFRNAAPNDSLDADLTTDEHSVDMQIENPVPNKEGVQETYMDLPKQEQFEESPKELQYTDSPEQEERIDSPQQETYPDSPEQNQFIESPKQHQDMESPQLRVESPQQNWPDYKEEQEDEDNFEHDSKSHDIEKSGEEVQEEESQQQADEGVGKKSILEFVDSNDDDPYDVSNSLTKSPVYNLQGISPVNVSKNNDSSFHSRGSRSDIAPEVPVKGEMLSLDDIEAEAPTPLSRSRRESELPPQNHEDSNDGKGSMSDDFDDNMSNDEKQTDAGKLRMLQGNNVEPEMLLDKPSTPDRRVSLTSAVEASTLMESEMDMPFRMPRRSVGGARSAGSGRNSITSQPAIVSAKKSESLNNSLLLNLFQNRNSTASQNSLSQEPPDMSEHSSQRGSSASAKGNPRPKAVQRSSSESQGRQLSKASSGLSVDVSTDDSSRKKGLGWGLYIANSFSAMKDSLSKQAPSSPAEMATPTIFDPEDEINWDFWGELMNDYEGTKKNRKNEFKRYIYQGIPDQLRGTVWQLLCDGKDLALERAYVTLIERTSIHEKVIQRDLSRTFPSHERFSDPSGAGQESLFNIIKAYSLYDQQVGYCQGIAFIVGALLLNMPDEEAFSLLVKLMKDYGLRDLYAPAMIGLQVKLYQYDRLLEEYFPSTHNHLVSLEINSNMYASQWFLTMFAYRLPLAAVMRILDIVLFEGLDTILNFALSMIKRNQVKIETIDTFEACIEFLKNGLFDVYNGMIDLLILDAATFKMSPRHLEKYSHEFIAMQQKKENPENLDLKELRSENRRLTETIRKMEQEFEILNKEHVDLANRYTEVKSMNEKMSEQCRVMEDQLSEFTKNEINLQGKAEGRVKEAMDKLAQKNVDLTSKNAKLLGELDLYNSTLATLRKKLEESEMANVDLQQKYARIIEQKE